MVKLSQTSRFAKARRASIKLTAREIFIHQKKLKHTEHRNKRMGY
jgi:hypothetical protein